MKLTLVVLTGVLVACGVNEVGCAGTLLTFYAIRISYWMLTSNSGARIRGVGCTLASGEPSGVIHAGLAGTMRFLGAGAGVVSVGFGASETAAGALAGFDANTAGLAAATAGFRASLGDGL